MRLSLRFPKAFFFGVLIHLNFSAFSQEENVWSLERSVRYALDHNLSIRQTELNERLANLNLQQSRLSQIPNINANIGYGRSFGRSVDPTTNQFVSGNYDFISAGGSADILVFGWFQKRNTIAANKYSLEAAAEDLDQLKNDVSLNVATGFLRALLAKEQIRVNEKQADLSKAQLEQTRQFVAAGRLPELNAAQLESQLASDSANLIASVSDYNSAILDMKALLNLDFNIPFEIQTPEVKIEEQLSLNNMNPETIYQEAARNFGAIKSSELKIRAAQKRIAAAKGALYPPVGINAQFGTSYATTYTEITSFSYSGFEPSGGFVFGGADTFLVYQPKPSFQTRRIPLGSQLENNFRQTWCTRRHIAFTSATVKLPDHLKRGQSKLAGRTCLLRSIIFPPWARGGDTSADVSVPSEAC